MEIAPGRIPPAITPLAINNKQKPRINLVFFQFPLTGALEEFYHQVNGRGERAICILSYFFLSQIEPRCYQSNLGAAEAL